MQKGKKQIAKLSKRQQGSNFSQQILQLISNLASNVRDAIEKGLITDPRGNKMPMPCSTKDLLSGFTPEQLGAVEEFISVWYVEPDPLLQPPAPPKPPNAKK